MANLFGFLSLASLIALVVGLIKPTVFTRFLGKGVNRKKVGLVFGVSTLLFMTLLGMVAPKKPTIALENFKDNIEVEEEEYRLAGKVTPADSTLKVEENDVSLDSSGKFSHVLKLKDGENQIKIVATKEYEKTEKLIKIKKLTEEEIAQRKKEAEERKKAEEAKQAEEKARAEAVERSRVEEEARKKAEEAARNAPIVLSGTGQQASSKFHLDRGLKIFKMEFTGSGNFAIFLLDSNGNKLELLVNEIGNFNGSKAVQITDSGDYLLDITADGSWKVTIEK